METGSRRESRNKSKKRTKKPVSIIVTHTCVRIFLTLAHCYSFVMSLFFFVLCHLLLQREKVTANRQNSTSQGCLAHSCPSLLLLVITAFFVCTYSRVISMTQAVFGYTICISIGNRSAEPITQYTGAFQSDRYSRLLVLACLMWWTCHSTLHVLYSYVCTHINTAFPLADVFGHVRGNQGYHLSSACGVPPLLDVS